MNVSLTGQNFNTTNPFSASENGFANMGDLFLSEHQLRKAKRLKAMLSIMVVF